MRQDPNGSRGPHDSTGKLQKKHSRGVDQNAAWKGGGPRVKAEGETRGPLGSALDNSLPNPHNRGKGDIKIGPDPKGKMVKSAGPGGEKGYIGETTTKEKRGGQRDRMGRGAMLKDLDVLERAEGGRKGLGRPNNVGNAM